MLLVGPIADFIAFVVSVVFVYREFKRLKMEDHKLDGIGKGEPS